MEIVAQVSCFQRTIASEKDQVGPRDLAAVLLLDRPQQTAGLVKTGVIGPAVEGSKALLSTAVEGRVSVDDTPTQSRYLILPATATTVLNAVGTSAVPCHADEEATIVTVVGRPVVLAVGL